MEITDLTESIRMRVKQLTYESRTSDRAFANELGMPPATVNRQMKGESAVSAELIVELLRSRPHVSAEWLLRGSGPKYLGKSAESEDDKRVPDKEVLLLPAGARGGSIEEFEQKAGFTEYNSEVIRSPFINSQFCWEIRDDSMAPHYPAGTIIFFKKIKTGVIKYGNCYGLDTEDGFLFCKLKRSERSEEFLHCIPLNVEDGYEEYELPRKYVYAIFKVLGAMRW